MRWRFLKWYDEEGREHGIETWRRMYPGQRERQMADTTIGGWWRVSTVLLGLDHAHETGVRPVIFETMVFRKGSWEGLEMERYSTKEEALRGHEEMVRLVRSRRWQVRQIWKEVREGWRDFMERLREAVDGLRDWVHRRVG